MKILVISAIGLIGTVAAGCFGLMPFVGSTIPADSTMHRVVAQKPVIPMVESDSLSGRASTPAPGDLTQAEDAPEVPVKSTIESNLRYKVELLERGKEFLQGIAHYTAKLQKQEMVGGELLDEQTMAIKCRHNPFSVYLVWLSGDAGREVIYVDGTNNGKMIVHDGGWKSRIPAFSLPPDGTLAMHDTRYPVTTAGLLGVTRVMLGIHHEDLRLSNVASCELDEHQQFDGRPCYQFTMKYTSATDSPTYRKSITLIDCEWSVPLHTRHFEWSPSTTDLPEEELDEATLLESYSFTDIKLECNLTDHDFDRTNPEYRFR